MEEATIQDVSTETSQEVTTETDTLEATDSTSQDGEQTQDTSATATDETATTEEKPSVDYEKQYKELQAEYTRKSQEFAEFKKQHQPQVVDETGRPTSQFEQQFQFDVDNQEFSSYQGLARYLEPGDREDVESLLDRAKNCYARGDKANYNALLNQVKEHFNPQYIEQITRQKWIQEAQKEQAIHKALIEQRQTNSINVAQEIETNAPELYNLVNNDSESYSQPVFDVIKNIFDLTGSIDVAMANNAVKAIKEQAIREYKATQAIEKNKKQASVLSGDNTQPQSGELSMNDKAFWEQRYS